MDDIIKPYVEKILEIQDDAGRLSDEELREIALDIGLSEEDLARIDQKVKDGIQRAQGFMKHKVWGKAIEQWKEVLTLSPNSTDAKAHLAKSYLGRAQRADVEHAKELAEKVLQEDPSNAHAFEVLASINSPKPKLHLIIGGVFFLIAFAIVSTAIFITRKGNDKIAIHENHTTDLKQGKKTNVKQSNPFKYRSDNFPVDIDAPQGIEIDLFNSKYKTFPGSSHFDLDAVLRNGSQLEIMALKGIFTYHFLNGDVEIHENKIRHDYQGDLRPSDATAFQELRIFKNKSLKSVSLQILVEKSVKAPSEYPPAKAVAFKWGKGQSSTAFKLEIFERKASLAEKSFIGSRYHRATWEFKNKGQAFTHLKMKIEFLSENNQVFASDSFYVAANGAPVNPEESRIASSLENLKKGNYHHYQLSVIEMH